MAEPPCPPFAPVACAIAAAVGLASLPHCSGGGSGPAPAPASLTRAELLDPKSCAGCHAEHFRDWSGSMHAYAAEDPVFLAMNKRGQRETQGALGTFCVNCHAPMAVREGATKDGLNLAEVPAALKGVTCFFCHSTDAVEGTHDNPLRLAQDGVLRGPFEGGTPSSAHRMGYSALHDRDKLESSKLCGACHDIVNGHGVALERTFDEWSKTVFAQPSAGTTCGQCHMEQSATLQAVAQAPNVPLRRYHGHSFAGVDVALTPFPETESQGKRVQDLLNTTVQSALCVGQGNTGIHVIVDNVAAGHSFPSGAAQDRRAWTEVVAYSGGTVLYQSGVVADGAAVAKSADPDLWLFRDCIFDGTGKEIHMFWDAFENESHLMPGQATFDPQDPRFYQTHLYQTFPRGKALSGPPDRVTLRVRLQPVGLEVIDDLIASGDLDASVRGRLRNFDLGATPVVEWTAEKATAGYTQDGVRYTCVSNTNLNFQADKVLAPARGKCLP